MNPAESIKQFFETISLDTVAQIPQYYAADARFKDPFNEVQGVAHITRIFEHMYTQVQNPRFVVTALIAKEAQAFMRWDFYFDSMGKLQHIRGATHFEFNDAGLVSLHRDYWDAAEELYEKLPILSVLMRWIKRRLRVD